MPVIVGITTAIRIAKLAYRVSKVVYKPIRKTPAAARWFDRHRKAATIITTAASTAPLIYDLLNIDYSALQSFITKTGKFPKTRNYMEFPSTKRSRYTECYPNRRKRTIRRKY